MFAGTLSWYKNEVIHQYLYLCYFINVQTTKANPNIYFENQVSVNKGLGFWVGEEGVNIMLSVYGISQCDYYVLHFNIFFQPFYSQANA